MREREAEKKRKEKMGRYGPKAEERGEEKMALGEGKTERRKTGRPGEGGLTARLGRKNEKKKRIKELEKTFPVTRN
jgi:hypothetical protein